VTRRTFQEERAFVECDACGYALYDAVKAGTQRDREFTAPITVRLRDGQERHFHAVERGGYSCFDSWLRAGPDDDPVRTALGVKP
jgi:hypothetical protein